MNISIAINILYILFLFCLFAFIGSESYLKIGMKKQDGCRKAINKKGVTVIKLDLMYLTVHAFILPIIGMIYGAIAFGLQEGLFWLIDEILGTSLARSIKTINEYLVAVVYGLIIGCGFYFGKSLTACFAAEQVLKHAEDLQMSKYSFRNLRLHEALKDCKKSD